MALEEVTPRVIWVGTGATSSIELSVDSVPITFADDAYIVVEQMTDAGVVSARTAGVHYTITQEQVLPGGSAASLETIGGHLTDGYTWVAYRSSPVRQDGDIEDGGDFSPSDIEAMVDALAEVLQEQADLLARAPKISPFEALDFDTSLPPAAGNAGYMIVINDDEDGLEWAVPLSGELAEDAIEASEDAVAAAAAAAASAVAADSSADASAASATAADASADAAAASALAASNSEAAAALSETAAEAAADVAEASSRIAGFTWTYIANAGMADPGAGNMRLNHLTPSSATAIAFDDVTADDGAPNVADWLATWDDSTSTSSRGTLIARNTDDPSEFLIYTITGNSTDGGTWTQLSVTYLTGNFTPTNNDVLFWTFSRAGDLGATGPGSGDMLAANNLSEVTPGTARNNLGVGTGDSPQFANVNLGHASNTTLGQGSAPGIAAVEGVDLLMTSNVINSLVTGGAAVPLSATQGKNLAGLCLSLYGGL